MDDLEAQAAELVWQGACTSAACKQLCGRCEEMRMAIAAWARRLVAQSRAEADQMLAQADAVIAGHWYGHSDVTAWRLEDQAQPVQDAIARHRARLLAAEAEPGAQDRAGKGER